MADYFKNSENAYFRHVWYHMKENNVKSLREGVEAVKTGFETFESSSTIRIFFLCLKIMPKKTNLNVHVGDR